MTTLQDHLLSQLDTYRAVLDDYAMPGTQSHTSERAALTAVWEAIKLLTGDDGLHADDHLTRAQVLVEAQAALAKAIDTETVLAYNGGSSFGELAKVLGVSRQAVFQRIERMRG